MTMRPLIRASGILFLSGLLASLTAMVSVVTPSAGAAVPTLYPLPEATHARSLAPGANGSVWFVPRHGSKWEGPDGQTVGVLRADGTVGEFSLPGFEGPAPGPTGDVWVSGKQVNTAGESILFIGRLAASGQVESQYAVGSGDGRVKELAVAQGVVWFAHRFANGAEAIERLSTVDGGVRKFALGDGCEARAIAASERGGLWFSEACKRRLPSREYARTRSTVARIDPAGRIARYPIPRKGDPLSIAVGQNGTVWFGVTHRGFSPDWVGRITKAGTIAKYRIRGYPDSIAVGPDGRVWFRSSFGWKHPALASISPSGKRELFCVTAGCGLEPTDLVSAADGSLWFGLSRPNLNEGGGGNGIGITMEIENEAGSIGHLVP
jgi:streptogramin lyase